MKNLSKYYQWPTRTDNGRKTWGSIEKIKTKKAAGLDEIPTEIWLTGIFDDIFLRACNAVNKQNSMDKCAKICMLLLTKKGDIRITKNYIGITLTATTTKIFNALFLNRIRPKIKKLMFKQYKYLSLFGTMW